MYVYIYRAETSIKMQKLKHEIDTLNSEIAKKDKELFQSYLVNDNLKKELLAMQREIETMSGRDLALSSSTSSSSSSKRKMKKLRKLKKYSDDGLEFDPALSSSLVVISNDHHTVEAGGFCTAASSVIYARGLHSFRVRIDKVDRWAAIGLQEVSGIEDAAEYTYLSYGNKKIDDDLEEYGEAYGKGDVIRCEINCDNGVLMFFKNDKCQGIACRKVKCPVRPIVSLDSSRITAI